MASLRQACAWLGGLTRAGVHTVLRRARIVWKRARASIRSPDPDYDAKVADVAAVAAAQAQPGRIITVYLDEVTVERQPTVAHAYAPTGASEQARAVRRSKSNTLTRIVGALNALTGGVFHRRASTITVGFLVVFYQALCRAYPDAERIYVIQDNGPVLSVSASLPTYHESYSPELSSPTANWLQRSKRLSVSTAAGGRKPMAASGSPGLGCGGSGVVQRAANTSPRCTRPMAVSRS